MHVHIQVCSLVCCIKVCMLNAYIYFRWCPPRYIRDAPESKNDRIRKKWHILVEGENIPPPIKSFKVLCVLQYTSKKVDVATVKVPYRTLLLLSTVQVLYCYCKTTLQVRSSTLELYTCTIEVLLNYPLCTVTLL